MKQYPGYIHQTQYDMMQEAKHYSGIYPYCKGSKVLDIGANIGSFTYQAIKAGAEKIILVEASNRNFEFLKNQPFIKRFNDKLKVLHYAVVGSETQSDKILFYEGSGKDTSIDSTVYRRGRGDGYFVSTIQFDSLVEKTQPEILKIDIEGGEWQFDWDSIPESVEALAIELHVLNSNYVELIDNLRNELIKRWPILIREYDTYRFKKYVTKELVIAKKRMK